MSEPNNNRIIWDKESQNNNNNNNTQSEEKDKEGQIEQTSQGEAEILNPGFGGAEPKTDQPPIVPNTAIKEQPDQPIVPGQETVESGLGTTILPGGETSKEVQTEKTQTGDMVWTPPLPDEKKEQQDQVPIGQPTKPQTEFGTKRTFEKDFDEIIHSKEGGVVAKMIDEARAEEEEKEEQSPKSPKNIIFIILSIVLGLLAILLLFLIFVQKEPRIIEDKIVSSLIYADTHVGIDVTGLSPNKTEILIQKVIDERMAPNTVKQIYYLEEEMNVFRRLGVFRTMEYAGQNLEDESLTLEDTFMHGIHSTDFENPFFIAKVDSYERAYDVLRDWENAVVDDFSPFMNFPEEVSNRAVTDEFRDEIVANIPARVLRYTPRETSGDNFLEKVQIFFVSIIQPVFAQTEAQENPNQLQDFDVSQESEPSTCVLTASPDDPNIGQERAEEIEFLKESDRRIISKSEYDSLPSATQALYSCISTIISTMLQKNESDDDVCVVDRSKIPSEMREDNSAINQVLYKYQWGALSPTVKEYYVCFSSTGDSEMVLENIGERELTFENDVVNVCFDKTTGLRVPVGSANSFCINPLICIDDLGNYYQQGSPGEECVMQLDLLAAEKIDTFACWTNNLSLIDIIRGEAGGTCYDAFATTGAQFYSKYSIDNLRTVLRQTAALLIGMEKIAKLLFLNRLPGGEEIVGAMSTLADEMIYISHIDVFKVNVIRTLVGYAERTEKIILTLERIGFPENSFMNEIKIAIGYIREFLGLKHNVGWVTLDGYINVDDYADPLNFILLGETDMDVSIIQQSLLNLGLLSEEAIQAGEQDLDSATVAEMISTTGLISSSSGTLDQGTQTALIAFQQINGLSTTGIMDTATMEFMTQVIRAGGTLPGMAYTLDLFGEWTVAQFLRSGGVLIDPSGVILDGSALSGPDADYYETITIREFVEMGGEIYSLMSDSGENLSVITSDLWRELRLGSYGYDVQTAQIVLREEGLDVGALNGIYDSYVEGTVLEFQRLHGLPETGVLDEATTAVINGIIADKDLSGSGYYLDTNGFLQGFGELEGIEQPGLDILPIEASGERLLPGDIIFMYLFLDENTVLFVRNPETVREIVRRKANSQLSPSQ